MVIPLNYIVVSTKRKGGYKGVDDYGRLAIVKIVEKKDILDRRLEDLKNMRSDFIVSFFGLTESKDKNDFTLDIIKGVAFLHECGRFHGNLTPNESPKTVTKQTNQDPSTRKITEEVKELVRTAEQARELSQDCTSIALDVIKGIAFLYECGRFHGNLTPNESPKTVTKQINRDPSTRMITEEAKELVRTAEQTRELS
ncbi:hypothetical protein WN943_018249 [Citrus x changshan-huyou]